jgi:hypothetical protein
MDTPYLYREEREAKTNLLTIRGVLLKWTSVEDPGCIASGSTHLQLTIKKISFKIAPNTHPSDFGVANMGLRSVDGHTHL